MGSHYNKYQSTFLPELMDSLISQMTSELLLKVSGSNKIHQVVAAKNGKKYIHLINTSGSHSNPNVAVYDEILPVPNIKLQFRMDKMPESVLLQPGNMEMAYEYKNQVLQLNLPKVDLYTIIEIE